MEKVSLRRLYIELGRMCNLTCAHCCAGNMEDVEIDIKDVKKFFDNLEYIDNIVFTGGEPTLYVDKIDNIMELLVKMKIPINNINILTNGYLRSDQLVSVIKKYWNYMKMPEDTIIQFSTDEFHFTCKDDFNETILNENKEWYRKQLNIKQQDNNAIYENAIFLEGRAVNLSKIDLEKVPAIGKINHEKGKDKTYKIENELVRDNIILKNYIKKSIYFSAEGLIQWRPGTSYENQRKYFVGNIKTTDLITIIKQWNQKCLNSDTETDKTNLLKNESENLMVSLGAQLLEGWSEKIISLAKSGNKNEILSIKEAAIQPFGNFRIQYDKGYFKEYPKEAKLINEQIDVFFKGIDSALQICDNPILRQFI